MPSKERYARLKKRAEDLREMDDLFSNPPDHIRKMWDQTSEADKNLGSRILEDIAADEKRRLAAYSADGNSALKAKAAIRLAKFAAKFDALISGDQSAMHVARIIKHRGDDTRAVAAIAVDVRNLRNRKTKNKN